MNPRAVLKNSCHIFLKRALVRCAVFFVLLQMGCTSASDKKLAEAEQAYETKNYAQAVALSEAVLKTSPNASAAHQLKVRALVAADDISAALAHYDTVEKKTPDVAPSVIREIILSIIRASLQHENYFVRSAAIKAVGEMGDADLTAMILPSLKDSAVFVRFFTVEAIGQLESPDILKLVMAAGQDPDGMVRVAVIKVLASLGQTHRGVQINNLLATFTQDRDLTVRLLALAAISKNGDEDAFSKLIAEIEKLPAEALASGVAALGRSGNAAAIPYLKTYLTDENESIRMYAAEAMGDMPSAAFYPALENALKDKDPAVRGSAATTLGKLGDKQAIPAIEALIDDTDPMVRISAAEGLKRLGESRFAQYEAALSDLDYGVRHYTIGSLRRVWAADGLPLLTTALKDEAPRVRTTAIRAIGEVGGAESLPRLMQMMTDSDLAVRTYAAGNVGRLFNKMAGKTLKKSEH
ncbi:MAG: HEAT repeat domain-containing protein [Nitrospiria bacterium]